MDVGDHKAVNTGAVALGHVSLLYGIDELSAVGVEPIHFPEGMLPLAAGIGTDFGLGHQIPEAQLAGYSVAATASTVIRLNP